MEKNLKEPTTPPIENATENMETLAEAINAAIAKGYTENFMIEKKGLTTDKEKFYQPEEVKICNFYRFEGYSDPMDNSILYLIELPDGKKGTLTDAYGSYSDATVSNFVHDVEDIQKKVKK